MPADERFDFKVFYDRLAARGYVIYPGKLTVAPSFRIGCIGQVTPEDMKQAVAVIGEELLAMGVRDCGPAASGAKWMKSKSSTGAPMLTEGDHGGGLHRRLGARLHRAGDRCRRHAWYGRPSAAPI
ncbi:MAG: hypothetical protein R3F54_06560 [Alphaproteobacteria bacterium]